MRGSIVLALLLPIAAHAAAQPATLFDGAGYRIARYRAPVDRDPAPARRIAPQAVRALAARQAALLIDVLPAEGATRDPATGTWHLAEPHETIPGARWFPNVAAGVPDPWLWHGFAARILVWQRRHPGAPIIVFCRIDCWMSWNAARRLARSGVRHVRWFAEGIEGWREAGGALTPVVPEVIPPPHLKRKLKEEPDNGNAYRELPRA